MAMSCPLSLCTATQLPTDLHTRYMNVYMSMECCRLFVCYVYTKSSNDLSSYHIPVIHMKHLQRGYALHNMLWTYMYAHKNN